MKYSQEAYYLFAYDISDRRRSRKVLEYLRQWRINGQLSLHEMFLMPNKAHELSVELMSYIDRKQDRLILCRLSQRSKASVYTINKVKSPIMGYKTPLPIPSFLPKGWYLLTYDIRDKKRLAKIHRITAKYCIFLQRSVYLYHGNGKILHNLMKDLSTKVSKVDDVRLYAFSKPENLWFLSGPIPPILGINDKTVKNDNLWIKFLK